MLDQATLKSILHYDPETGEFTWAAISRQNHKRIGTKAGSLHRNGYWRILFNKVEYFAHRLAWLYMTGEWPPCQIDHINRNKLDNRFANLRPANAAQQAGNRKRRARGASPYQGICRTENGRKWWASIKIKGQTHHLGTHDTAEQARDAYNVAAKAYYGEFYVPVSH